MILGLAQHWSQATCDIGRLIATGVVYTLAEVCVCSIFNFFITGGARYSTDNIPINNRPKVQKLIYMFGSKSNLVPHPAGERVPCAHDQIHAASVKPACRADVCPLSAIKPLPQRIFSIGISAVLSSCSSCSQTYLITAQTSPVKFLLQAVLVKYS